MKTVTIPTCANPFVVIVNGIKYTYPAGATVEVPDDVAEVIEQHEEAKPEPAPVQPPFASVPSSGESGGGASGGGGLPVVDITSVVSQVDGMYTAELTEAENAALSAVAINKTPVIINAPIVAIGDATIECSALFNRGDTGSVLFYTAVIFLLEKSISLAFACNEGVWVVMGMEMSNG